MSSVDDLDGGLLWRLRVDEHALLVVMLRELDVALDAPTDDPVIQRLFPAALDGDEDEDAELRMLIASDLLLERHEAIRLLLAVLDRVEVPPEARTWHEQAVAATPTDDDGDERTVDPTAIPTVDVELRDEEPGVMLAVLNDLRLALAARVGLAAVELPQLVDERDERTRSLLDMMDHFAYFQMQLLRHIDPVAVEHSLPDPR